LNQNPQNEQVNQGSSAEPGDTPVTRVGFPGLWETVSTVAGFFLFPYAFFFNLGWPFIVFLYIPMAILSIGATYFLFGASGNFFYYILKVVLVGLGVNLSLAIAFVILSGLVQITLHIGHFLSRAQIRTLYRHREDIGVVTHLLDSMAAAGIYAPIFLYALTALCLPVFQNLLALRPSTTLLVLITAFLILLYSYFLFSSRSLELSTFYRLRRLFIPYLVTSAPAILIISFAGYLAMYMQCLSWTFIGMTDDSLWGLGSIIIRLWGVPPWDLYEAGIIESTIVATCIAALVIWFLPMIIKKDWRGMTLWTVAVTSPFFMPELMKPLNLFVGPVKSFFEMTPAPVIAVVLGKAVESVTNLVKSRIGNLPCLYCTESISRMDRFCRYCGKLQTSQLST